MASFIYSSFLDDLFNGRIDVSKDNFWVMLVTSEYSPDKNDHARRSDIAGEVSGQGYLAGGNPAEVMKADGGRAGSFDITLGSAEWQDATISATGAVYYWRPDNLVAFIDFGHDVTSINGTFALTPSMLQIRN